MKFGGHETFHLRDNWIFKGMRMLEEQGDVFNNVEKSIEILGVGTNMVKSIRYWLIATGLAEVTDHGMRQTAPGTLLLKYDPYLDRLGSSWILHFYLSTNKKNTTTWYWFFNNFGVSEFSTDSAVHYLENYCSSKGKKVNTNTLVKDINTLLRMYVEPEFTGNKTPENTDICPLSKLFLISKQTNGLFKVNSPEIEELPLEMFGFCLIQFWKNELNKIFEFSFDELINRDCSPVKVLCLNTDRTIDLLDRLVEKFPKQFSYFRSGGFFTIKVHSDSSVKMLNEYYGERNG